MFPQDASAKQKGAGNIEKQETSHIHIALAQNFGVGPKNPILPVIEKTIFLIFSAFFHYIDQIISCYIHSPMSHTHTHTHTHKPSQPSAPIVCNFSALFLIIPFFYLNILFLVTFIHCTHS